MYLVRATGLGPRFLSLKWFFDYNLITTVGVRGYIIGYSCFLMFVSFAGVLLFGMVDMKRENGNGSIVKRGGSFSLRFLNPVTGKMTMAVLKNPDGSRCSCKEEAERAARDVILNNGEINGLKDKEHTLVELAKTRRFIASLQHRPGELWELFVNSPSFNKKMSVQRKKQLEMIAMSFINYCRDNGVNDCSGITREGVERWLAVVCGGVSNRTYNEYLGDIRQVFGAVFRDLGLDENPADGIRARRRQTVSREAFTLEQMQAIMDCFENGFFEVLTYVVPCGKGDERQMERREVRREYCPDFLDEIRLAVMLGYMAGCRLVDACTMKWSNVNLKERLIRYVPQKTAGSSGVVCSVPIVDERLLNALEGANHSGEFVMPNLAEWHGRNPSSLTRVFCRLFECATGVSSGERREGRARQASVHGFHALRHTFVSFCANAGISLEICASIVGHSMVNTTRIYSHITDETKRRALMQISGDAGGNETERERLMDWAKCADADKVRKIWEIARLL